MSTSTHLSANQVLYCFFVGNFNNIFFFRQIDGVSEPAALPDHQRQSDREPGENRFQLSIMGFCFIFCLHFFFAAICAQTGIWTELYKIEDTFTKPLRVGLNMTRAHYEKELQNTMEDKKAKTRGQSSFFFSSTTCIMNVKNTVIIAETGLF